MARKRGGLAGIWGLPLSAGLLCAVPSLALASQTNPKTLPALLYPDRNVCPAKLMPFGALGLDLVVNPSKPTGYVGLLSDTLQMRWVKARPVAAQVVNLHPFRDWPFKVRVRKTMGVESLGLFVDTKSGNTIAVPESAGPHPALIVSADVFGKAVVEVLAGIHETRVHAFSLESNLKGV